MFAPAKATNSAQVSAQDNEDLLVRSSAVKGNVEGLDLSAKKESEVNLDTASIKTTEQQGVSIAEKAKLVQGAVQTALVARGLTPDLAAGYAQLAAVYAVAEEGRSHTRSELRKNAGFEEDIDPVLEEQDEMLGFNEELENLEKLEQAEKLAELGAEPEDVQKLEDKLAQYEKVMQGLSNLGIEAEQLQEIETAVIQGADLTEELAERGVDEEQLQKIDAWKPHIQDVIIAHEAVEVAQAALGQVEDLKEYAKLEEPINLESGIQDLDQEELIELAPQNKEYIENEMPSLDEIIAPEKSQTPRLDTKIEVERAIDLDAEEQDPRAALLDQFAAGEEQFPKSDLFAIEQPTEVLDFRGRASDFQKLTTDPLNPFAKVTRVA